MMPTLAAQQLRDLDGMRQPYPACPVCGTGMTPNPVYTKIRGRVRVTLICPNRDEPHPAGQDAVETFLRPGEARTLGL